MVRTKPSLFRRVERSIVARGMSIVVFFLERVVLRSARKSHHQ